jgi:hypothetical protein
VSLITSYLNRRQQVCIEPRLGTYETFGGTPRFATGAWELARVNHTSRLVRNETGELVQAVAEVLLRPEAYVRAGDRLRIVPLWGSRNWDDGTYWDGDVFEVVSLYVSRRLDGSARHQIAYLGSGGHRST